MQQKRPSPSHDESAKAIRLRTGSGSHSRSSNIDYGSTAESSSSSSSSTSSNDDGIEVDDANAAADDEGGNAAGGGVHHHEVDYHSMYPELETREERQRYKEEFVKHYNRYMEIYAVLNDISNRFTDMEERIKLAPVGSEEWKVRFATEKVFFLRHEYRSTPILAFACVRSIDSLSPPVCRK